MSSPKFVCDLAVSRRLRRLLLAVAVLAWLGGSLLVAALPVPVALRVTLGLLFGASCWLEFRAQRRGMARIDGIRIRPRGPVECRTPDGEHLPLELLSGSVVLDRGAWLRLRFPDGTVSGEWLAPSCGEREEWRMLQLLWRQSAGSLGRPLRS
jgi:hypothetical protein